LDYEALSFKQRYYREKYPEWFDKGVALARDTSGSGNPAAAAQLSSAQQVRLLVQNYCQGLKWVAAYYYEGCRSWKWYFAYRYAPLASDIVNVAQLDLTLQLGYPFRPMEQLLGVLPPASGKFLPPAYRALMDPRTSSIADFYPLDFSIDMNGKRSTHRTDSTRTERRQERDRRHNRVGEDPGLTLISVVLFVCCVLSVCLQECVGRHCIDSLHR
jgi:hypothetical protein